VPDQVFEEDSGPWSIADLDDVFSDPDNDNISYTVSAPEPVETTLDDNRMLTISVPDNFNATGLAVIISAFDGTVTSTDTFMVDITSINDMPTDYSLINPHNYNVLTNPWVIFRWEESVDAVEDSAVTYALVLSRDDSLYWYRDLDVTEMLMARRSIISDTTDTTRIEWWVWAYDGIDSLRSTQTFKLSIAPIAAREVEEEPLPTELKVGPVYPNPFNDVITIHFDLPWEGLAEVTIHDLRGRLIRTLVSDDMSVGRYRAYWDGFDATGARAASGVYLCRLKVHDSVEMVQIILIR